MYDVASPRPRILVVDPDPEARDELSDALEHEGYSVERSGHAEAAPSLLQANTLDAVLLELDGAHGVRVARRLHEKDPALPVMALSAAGAVETQVAALDAGVDDYLVKPYALPVLLARLRALLRRSQVPRRPRAGQLLTFADLELSVTEHRARRGEEELDLTRTEFALLELLLRHPEEVLSRPFIFEHVWGYDVRFSSNSLGVYVGMLRRKTEAGGKPRLIQTVRAIGYVLRV